MSSEATIGHQIAIVDDHRRLLLPTDEGGNQRSSEAIIGHQIAIVNDHRRLLLPPDEGGNQMSSDAIRGTGARQEACTVYAGSRMNLGWSVT